MQVHNELSKSDYFQFLSFISILKIENRKKRPNSQVLGGRRRKVSLQTKVLATTREVAPRECRCIGNTLVSTTTTTTVCLHVGST